MKVFISADIEGCCGVFSNIETHKNEAVYAPFAKQMTKEVLAVCEAAHEAGADEIVVKDGHGDASNIDPLQMPSYVTLIRGKSGHPYNMMFGLDPTFDAVLYVGYHAAAGCPEFAVSHTSTGNSLYITLNGKRMSEFMLNSFTAASLGVPVAFISGDEAICAAAKELVPEISLLVYLSQKPRVDTLKELADITGMSRARLALALQKLSMKEFIQTGEQADVVLLAAAEPVLAELGTARKDYEMAKYAGFSEEEMIQYAFLSNRIKENICRVLKKEDMQVTARKKKKSKVPRV